MPFVAAGTDLGIRARLTGVQLQASWPAEPFGGFLAGRNNDRLPVRHGNGRE